MNFNQATIEKEIYMPHIHRNRRVRCTAGVLLILLAALGLAACGGSSNSSSGVTNASASTTTGKRGGPFAVRASALRECLKKEGITLPERKDRQGTPGAGGPGGPYDAQPPTGGPYGQPPSSAPGGRGPFGSGGAGGPQLPKGVTRAQFEAAMKKCGGGVLRRGGFNTAQGRQRFAKFAECMRQNGIKLPTPNTSGKGPIFNTKGINTNGAAFKAADAKCMKELRPDRSAPGSSDEGGVSPQGGAEAGATPEGPSPGA
ncbi:MAG TPA: hypothetical protein VMB05_06410 [Solirubrobacteraceae bacterium]|nr:hypothetical protein [Solirubrobacteraceae bacterium]